MGQKKFSQLPADSSPTVNDSIPTYDADTVLTKRVTISDLITLFFNNIPAGGGNPITRHTDGFYDYVASGGVWSGDSYGSNRNASMTAMVIYINGRRISISAVTARTFTASKDTYIDVLDNADGTGTLVYTEVSNNAASPSLAANSVRIGIIVTGASTIAAAGSVNQGQETKVLPIASSQAYQVTDSLGNLICPRDPNRRLLGYRQILANVTTTSTSFANITGLAVPVIIPSNLRKIQALFTLQAISGNSSPLGVYLDIADGSTEIAENHITTPGSGYHASGGVGVVYTPSSGSHTFNARNKVDANTGTYYAAATAPASLAIMLS